MDKVYKKNYYSIGTSPQAYTGWNDKEYNGRHNVEGMIAMIRIAFDLHPSCDRTHILATFVCKHWQNSCWSPPIHLNNHAYLVSQHLVSERSVQAKDVFLL